MFSISAAPKKKLTQGLSYTVWMLLEEEQQNSTFSHLTLMSLSLQSTVTISSAGTYFVTGVGNKKRVIALGPVLNALGAPKAEALPGFHAFSGSDVTGRFAGKGKLSCWQALNRCSIEVISAFAALGTCKELGVDTERAIETFVCHVYEPGTTVVDVGDLRWKLFSKNS